MDDHGWCKRGSCHTELQILPCIGLTYRLGNAQEKCYPSPEFVDHLLAAIGGLHMAHAKKASQRRRRKTALPAIGIAGLSLSLAGGASASTSPCPRICRRKALRRLVILLGEEEISDVSLATFYVFDRESLVTSQFDMQLAARGCGGCRGCRGCGARLCGARLRRLCRTRLRRLRVRGCGCRGCRGCGCRGCGVGWRGCAGCGGCGGCGGAELA